ncbi:MAG: HEAT repeat domain-containing protein [Deltaproteobacteria bacterium]|nr:HEAT repeat domain-containing protein [Deltaproteobacteria bacterium]
MGLFDLFGSKEERDRNALRKLGQKITERYGPAENRQKAIDQLASLGTPAALKTLCLRFTVRSEVGITDDEEKESVRRHLVAAGTGALAPVKEFLAEQEGGSSWGLRVLAELLPDAEVRSTAVALLAEAGRRYTRDPEKKLTLLAWLTEHHGGSAAAGAGADAATEAAILPLLEDFADDVRIRATRALSRLGAGEAGREALIQLLLRDTDNARVRGEVLQALCDLAADVKGHRPSVEPLLVEPFFLDREGRVKKRG